MAIKKMSIEEKELHRTEIRNIGANASDVDVYRYPLGSPEEGKIIPDMSIYVSEDDLDPEKLTDTLASIETDITNLNNNKQNKLTFDDIPSNGSDNPVKSNGIYDAINNASTTLNTKKQDKMQYTSLPASPTVGMIIQYIGETTLSLIKGHFYEYKSGGRWEEVPVSTVNVDGVVPQDKGGTGSNDGSINGVKLGFDGTTYGYYKQGATSITPFRQPTGTATAGDVLSGVHFANANSDDLTGAMNNYSNNKQTVTPTATGLPNTPNETLALDAGYHTGVIVNRINIYNAGVNAQKAVSWEDTMIMKGGTSGNSTISLKNVLKWKYSYSGPGIPDFYYRVGTSSTRVDAFPNTYYNVPNNTNIQLNVNVFDGTTVTVTFYRQCQILH